MDKILNRIVRLSKNDNKTDLEKCIKIQEEVGELSAALLKIKGKKGANGQTKQQIYNNILEECCDIIIVTYSLINKLKYRKRKVIKTFNEKLNKVELNIKKQKLWKKQFK